jgi:hypothetical protein
MAKKKATSKKKSSRKKTKDEPMSKGFGHLTILPSWVLKDTGAVVDGGDRQIDSMECWDGYEWDEE